MELAAASDFSLHHQQHQQRQQQQLQYLVLEQIGTGYVLI